MSSIFYDKYKYNKSAVIINKAATIFVAFAKGPPSFDNPKTVFALPIPIPVSYTHLTLPTTSRV